MRALGQNPSMAEIDEMKMGLENNNNDSKFVMSTWLLFIHIFSE